MVYDSMPLFLYAAGESYVNYTDRQKYWIWLSSVRGIGTVNFFKLMGEYGEAENVWGQLVLARTLLTPALFKNLQEARNQAYMDDLFERMEKGGMRAVTQLDDEYPERLRGITGAPPTLYVLGDAAALNPEKAIGIVGSRRITADGVRFTYDVAKKLAGNGVCVISGLALGADRRAHEGCLDGGAPTLAVLGSALDRLYPAENADLARRIVDEGGALISEYIPGTPPAAHQFPARNRIVSGMSDGVLMTEGTAKSGAMITMAFAQEQRRARFAVPGSVYSLSYEGTNRLIIEGAQACVDARQILDYFCWESATEAEQITIDALSGLDEQSRRVVELLRYEEKSFNDLISETKMNSASLNSLLTILEMQGIIRQSAGKMFRAIV